MKPSDSPNVISTRWRVVADVLLWALPVLLLIPNISLCITEISYTGGEKAVNILVPAGVYCLLCALSRKIGRTALFFIPLMVLCAFQIVLLFLYGESIIAVDMFLNVATTSVSEATELLGNLTSAIVVVCLFYLPPIIIGIILCAKGAGSGRRSRLAAAWFGGVMLASGLAFMLCAYASPRGYAPTRKLFPVNVISNMFTAIERSRQTEGYFKTSEGFSFNAVSSRASAEPEVYVLVIGETSRAGNWQLNGYDRPTNPRLVGRSGLVSCQKALSESNTTHKSVPLLMSHLGADEFADSICRTKSVIEAFGEAGYETAFFSNQKRNHSLIDFFGEQASEIDFITDDDCEHYDIELCALLDAFLGEPGPAKRFVVLHTYGSHFNYRMRYPDSFNYFRPDDSSVASLENKEGLVNAYDNSIRYTDAFIDSIISTVAARGCPAAMVYLADHGEDIYDDDRCRFLHASPTPTYWQIHVPMLVWMSDGYRNEHPEKYAAAIANSGKNISSSRSAFHTLLSLAGISSPVYDKTAAVTEKAYREPKRAYLNDYNEAVSLKESGLRDNDMLHLAHARINP